MEPATEATEGGRMGLPLLIEEEEEEAGHNSDDLVTTTYMSATIAKRQ